MMEVISKRRQIISRTKGFRGGKTNLIIVICQASKFWQNDAELELVCV